MSRLNRIAFVVREMNSKRASERKACELAKIARRTARIAKLSAKQAWYMDEMKQQEIEDVLIG
jgi:hypothetical protein